MDANKVFSELARTGAYGGTAPLPVKREIFLSVWKKAVPQLKNQYNEEGIGESGENGFGFLVEAFVKESPIVPRNSEAGERLARLLIHALQTGDEAIGTGWRFYNPDLIWIEHKGRKAVITGIGEIKSSAEAFSKQLKQINGFEPNLRLLLNKIEKDKQSGNALRQLAFKKVEIACPLKKVLIMPAGQKKRAERLPAGWEVMEIEFSYDELIFIAKRIWPKFSKELNPESGYLAGYEELMKKFEEWGEPIFKRVFADSSLRPFPVWEYLLYAFAIGKLPLTDAQVRSVTACAREADFIPSFPPKLINLSDISKWERKFLDNFIPLCGQDDRTLNYLLHFLYDFRSFSAQLKKIIKKRGLKAELNEKAPALDLLDT